MSSIHQERPDKQGTESTSVNSQDLSLADMEGPERTLTEPYEATKPIDTANVQATSAELTLQRGLELKTVAPEDATRIRAIADAAQRYEATKPIDTANVQATSAELTLQRGLELKTVTPEDATRIRAIADAVERREATKPIDTANVQATVNRVPRFD